MLQTMVSLIDVDRTVHVQVHDGLVDIALAALSAEPVTIEELRAAMTRFVDASVADYFVQQLREGLATRSVEGGHMIIDLTAKLLVNDTSIPEMPRLGNVLACDEQDALEQWIPYRIPDDWEMIFSTRGWETRAAERRKSCFPNWNGDSRAVLYGALAGCLVHRWIEKAAESDEPTLEIQDWWLLTPREDLGDQPPREMLLAKREFIDGDIQDQGQTWTMTGRCPPGLAPTSHAYRCGGFGSHEIILYHELVAYLLMHCERRMRPGREVDVAVETRHLEQLQQEWLHQPQEELYDQSPAALIARERSRLPAVVPKGHTGEHDDCPICRMMFDSGQPMIWQLDNFMLEHRFATSFFAHRSEWEQAQREWEEMNRDWEQNASHPPEKQDASGDDQRVWQRSHTNMHFFEEMPPLEACGVMMFSIGGHLAELVQDLKPTENAVELIQLLHERFDDLRSVLKEQEDVWMIQSAVGAFVEALNQVSGLRNDLTAKCADLEDKLEFLRRRYQEHFGQDQEAAL